METTLMIGRLFGPTLVIVGIGLLLNAKYFKKMFSGLKKERICIFFIGLITLVTGLAIIVNSNIWEFSWKLIITLVGWAAFIKGIFFIVLPKYSASLASDINLTDTLLRIIGLLYMVLGAFVCIHVF